MRIPAIALMAALLVSGCDANLSDAGRTATSLRSATERMASNSAARSDERQAEIMAAAREMDLKNAELAGDPSTPQRYEMRRDGGGWSVYDTQTGRVARMGSKSQAGLSRSRAEDAMAELRADDAYTSALTEGRP